MPRAYSTGDLALVCRHSQFKLAGASSSWGLLRGDCGCRRLSVLGGEQVFNDYVRLRTQRDKAMVQTIQARDLTLHDVKAKFGLRWLSDDQFFREWIDDLPELTDLDKRSLDQVKADYLYLSEYPMPESLVSMVIVSPLLALAGFYRPPFRVTAEAPVQISAEDEEEIVRGRLNVLVLQQQLWVLVIESKNTDFSLNKAIPQALAYMMANPNPEQPAFGLVTNGSEFIFIKLTKQGDPQYALSDVFPLVNGGNDLYIVVSVLKRIGALLT